MQRIVRLTAVVALSAAPLAFASTSSADVYSPPSVYSPPVVTPPATPAPAAAPAPAVVLTGIKTSTAAAFKTLKFARVLGQGHSTITIPITGVGTYSVVISYRSSGKYQSIAKGQLIVKNAGKTTNIAVKPTAHGKSIYKTLKKQKKSTINVQITVSYETGGKTVATTFNRKFHK